MILRAKQSYTRSSILALSYLCFVVCVVRRGESLSPLGAAVARGAFFFLFLRGFRRYRCRKSARSLSSSVCFFALIVVRSGLLYNRCVAGVTAYTVFFFSSATALDPQARRVAHACATGAGPCRHFVYYGRSLAPLVPGPATRKVVYAGTLRLWQLLATCCIPNMASLAALVLPTTSSLSRTNDNIGLVTLKFDVFSSDMCMYIFEICKRTHR